MCHVGRPGASPPTGARTAPVTAPPTAKVITCSYASPTWTAHTHAHTHTTPRLSSNAVCATSAATSGGPTTGADPTPTGPSVQSATIGGQESVLLPSAHGRRSLDAFQHTSAGTASTNGSRTCAPAAPRSPAPMCSPRTVPGAAVRPCSRSCGYVSRCPPAPVVWTPSGPHCTRRPYGVGWGSLSCTTGYHVAMRPSPLGYWADTALLSYTVIQRAGSVRAPRWPPLSYTVIHLAGRPPLEGTA